MYNLSPAQPNPKNTSFEDAMSTYIQETALPTMDSLDSSDLEFQIAEVEILQVIKGLKNGKCPSPGGFLSRFQQNLCHAVGTNYGPSLYFNR